MPITEEQERFLIRYVNSQGKFYDTLESLGLELIHFLAWREDDDFDYAYRNASRQIAQFIKEQNKMIALQEINKALVDGITHESVTNIHIIEPDGNTQFQAKKQVVKRGIPAWAIKAAIREDNIVQAIATLVNEGVLPTPMARKLLAISERLTSDFQAVFDIQDTKESISDRKAIALIKAAILGAKEE
jgi:hypothetical protein